VKRCESRSPDGFRCTLAEGHEDDHTAIPETNHKRCPYWGSEPACRCAVCQAELAKGTHVSQTNINRDVAEERRKLQEVEYTQDVLKEAKAGGVIAMQNKITQAVDTERRRWYGALEKAFALPTNDLEGLAPEVAAERLRGVAAIEMAKRLAGPDGRRAPDRSFCEAVHAETGAVCGLHPGHEQNHKGIFKHGITQWPVAAPPERSEP